jgi:adenylate cyclase
MTEDRQLAAIMFTDLVGYTTLMGQDETAAYQLLKRNRKIQKPLIEQYGGKWLKEMGDGVLASFQTVSNAVYCAIEIHRKCKEGTDLKLRIGIHLGEVILEDGDVFGDGVNIASRLEPLAPVGGIYVSESVYRNIRNKKGIKSDFVREEQLKNVDHPIRIYKIDVEASEEIHPDGATQGHQSGLKKMFIGWKKAVYIILPVLITMFIAYLVYDYLSEGAEESGIINPKIGDKSLAVLPFDNLSNDPSQDYISDGMMEAILSHLNKIDGLRLTSKTTMMTYKGSNKKVPEIAKEVAVRYVLAGSVMRVQNTLRITVQLIDGERDEQLWSEYYDGTLSELLPIQSKIAQIIADKLDVNINQSTKVPIESVPTENIQAYDLYLKAIHLEDSLLPGSEKVRELLEEAIALDPNYAAAYAELGAHWIFRSMYNRKYLPLAESSLNQAIKLDPNLVRAHQWLDYLNLWLKWDFYTAEREMIYANSAEPSNPFTKNPDFYLATGHFKEALEAINDKILNEPNNATFHAQKGMILYFNNQPAKALESLDQASKLNKDFAPQNYYSDAGRGYLYLHKYEKAADLLEEGLNSGMISGYFSRYRAILAIAYYHLGEKDKSLNLLEEIKQQYELRSANSPCFYIAMIYSQMGEIDKAFEWLEKSYQDHEVEMYWLKVEPPFEPLHEDPRWQAMLDQVGFPD